MSYPFQRSIAIQAAPERVYEYLTNIPANREWGEMADLELVARVEWHQGELFPRVGFIVTDFSYPTTGIVSFYNGGGTAER